MPAVVASGKEQYPCTGCIPFDSVTTPECKRDKKSGSKKDKKKKDKSPGRQKKEAAGGDNQCKNDKEVRRVDKIDTANNSNESKLNIDSIDKVGKESNASKDEKCKDSDGKLGKDAKDGKLGKDAKDSKSEKDAKRKDAKVKDGKSNKDAKRRDEKRFIFRKLVKDEKLSAVYSCTDIQLDAPEGPSVCSEVTAKTCKETEREIKQREKEARRRARQCAEKKKKTARMLGKAYKCKNVKNPNLRQIGYSAEANCTKCCELLGLYLKETYKFYTCICKDGTPTTHFQETFCQLMRTVSCMCRDCYLVLRYIWRLLFV